MNVRMVHGALWRELGEPIEFFRRLPWYVRHTMFVLLFLGVAYLMTQVYNWREYEENALRRIERDEAVKKQPSEPPKPVSPNQGGTQ